MESIKLEVRLLASIQKVWTSFTEPNHVQKWFFVAPNWQCLKSLNELRKEGKFSYKMGTKKGEHSYEFNGSIVEVVPMDRILSVLDDGRNLEFYFEKKDENTTHFVMLFQPEKQNTIETQERFWSIVLNNFEKYVERN